MYAKALREKLAQISVNMQAILDAARADNNRGLKPEERESWNRLHTDYSNTESDIKIAETTETISNDLRNVPTEQLHGQFGRDNADARARVADQKNDPHAKAFSKFLRGGISALSTAEQSLMRFVSNVDGAQVRNAQSNTNTAGGYLIP